MLYQNRSKTINPYKYNFPIWYNTSNRKMGEKNSLWKFHQLEKGKLIEK